MSWFTRNSAMVDDDRGRAVPLWSWMGQVESDDPLERAVAMRAIQISSTEHLHPSFILLFLLFMIWLVMSSVLMLPPFITWPPLVIGGFVAWNLQQRRVQKIILPAIRLTLLSEGRCASCAYDLRGLAVDADGCTVCPECQSAWRISPDMAEFRQARESLQLPPPHPEGETASDRASRDWLRSFAIAFGWKRTYGARDARGRMVELVNPSFFAPRPPRWEEIPPERRRSLRIKLFSLGWPVRLLTLFVIGPAAVSMVGLVGSLGPRGILNNINYGMIWMCIGAIWASVFLVGAVFHPITNSGRWLMALMLRKGHCPSCAARLPEPQGKTLACTACRCEWEALRERPRPAPARRPPDDEDWFRSIKPKAP